MYGKSPFFEIFIFYLKFFFDSLLNITKLSLKELFLKSTYKLMRVLNICCQILLYYLTLYTLFPYPRIFFLFIRFLIDYLFKRFAKILTDFFFFFFHPFSILGFSHLLEKINKYGDINSVFGFKYFR
jgi:hypothetical protein